MVTCIRKGTALANVFTLDFGEFLYARSYCKPKSVQFHSPAGYSQPDFQEIWNFLGGGQGNL